MDPLSPDYPWYTPYQFAGNKPIAFIDLDGLEEAPVNPGTFEGEEQNTYKNTVTSDPTNPGMNNRSTSSKVWHWHNESDGNNRTYDADWYSPEKYKEILTGTSANATTMRPLNLKLYMRDVIGLTHKVFTEEDLTNRELITLAQVVKHALERGSTIIEYEDYTTTSGGNQYQDVVMAGGTGGESGSKVWNKMWEYDFYALKTSFGQVAIKIVNDQVIIFDQFNFNDKNGNTEGKTWWKVREEWGGKVVEGGWYPYKQLRNYSSYFGSGNGEGTILDIAIPIILLDPTKL